MTKDRVIEAKELLWEAERELTQAQDALGSARGWGIYDILAGGGLISNFIKHRRIDVADEYVDGARRKLERACRLLDGCPGVSVEAARQLSGALRFFDVATKSFLASVLVQEKIARRREDTERLLAEVRALRHHLNGAG